VKIMGPRRRRIAVGFAAALALTVGGLVAGVAAGASHSSALSPVKAAQARASLLRYLRESTPLVQLAGDGSVQPATPNITAGRENASQAASFNWSGYLDSGSPGSFSSVSATWREPATFCTPEQRLAAFWIGLDGWNDSTVEQEGTIAYCFEGQPSYYTVYEMFPNNIVVVGDTVRPGDLITASVTVINGTSYKLSLTDLGNPANSFYTTQSCLPAGTCQDSSAEWIAERPATNLGVAPLSIFDWNPVNADQTSGGVTGGISSGPGPTEVTMVDDTSSYPLVSVSGLGWPGNSFDDRWLNSY
jgi:hypothetical protein